MEKLYIRFADLQLGPYVQNRTCGCFMYQTHRVVCYVEHASVPARKRFFGLGSPLLLIPERKRVLGRRMDDFLIGTCDNSMENRIRAYRGLKRATERVYGKGAVQFDEVP